MRRKRQNFNVTETQPSMEDDGSVENGTNDTDLNTNSTPITRLFIVESDVVNRSKDDYKFGVQVPTNYESDDFLDDDSGKSMYSDQQVRVFIHNVTLLAEDDIQNWDDSGYEVDRNDKR